MHDSLIHLLVSFEYLAYVRDGIFSAIVISGTSSFSCRSRKIQCEFLNEIRGLIRHFLQNTQHLYADLTLLRHSRSKQKLRQHSPPLTLYPNKVHIYLNINQLDALNFIMSLFQASTCFEHMCSSSGGQNCIIQPLVSSHLYTTQFYNHFD